MEYNEASAQADGGGTMAWVPHGLGVSRQALALVVRMSGLSEGAGKAWIDSCAVGTLGRAVQRRGAMERPMKRPLE